MKKRKRRPAHPPVNPDHVTTLVTSYELATDSCALWSERKAACDRISLIAEELDGNSVAVETFLLATRLLFESQLYEKWSPRVSPAFRHPLAIAFDMKLQWFLRQLEVDRTLKRVRERREQFQQQQRSKRT